MDRKTFKDVDWHKAYQSNNQKMPFYQHAWHQTYQSVFNTNPIVLGKDSWVAAFEIKDNNLHFHGGEEISDYMDIVGPEDQKHTAWSEIIKFAQNQSLTSLRLNNVPQSSATYHWFNEYHKSHPDKLTIVKEDTTPHVSPPENWQAFLQSLKRKYRKECKRKLKNYKKEYPNTKIIQSSHPSKDLHLLIHLMKQNPDKKNFLTKNMQAFFTQIVAALEDQVELLILCTDKQAVSATLAFTTANQRLLYNSGFTKDHYSGAGFYLKASGVKRAIEAQVDDYNFLQGDERYKYELGGKDSFVYKITLHV